MKKSIFLVFCALIFAAHSLAQQTSVGIRAGYTLSDVRTIMSDDLQFETDPNDAAKSLSSFHVGADARMALGEKFSLVASLLYARKGYRGEVHWPSGPADATWELHYLNLPIVVDFRIWKGLSLQGGAELGRLLSARLKSTENADVDNLFEDFDIGVIGGLEYRFPKGFFASARYVYGVYNIQELEFTDSTGNKLALTKTRNSATQFSVGYRYAIEE